MKKPSLIRAQRGASLPQGEKEVLLRVEGRFRNRGISRIPFSVSFHNLLLPLWERGPALRRMRSALFIGCSGLLVLLSRYLDEHGSCLRPEGTTCAPDRI